MDDQAQIEQGSKIIRAVYKASLKALFAIGVKSPDNVDKFSLHFSQELDKEFLKIGLFEKQSSEKIAGFAEVTHVEPPRFKVDPRLEESVKTLGLSPITVATLKRAKILTIEELMNIMQKDSLTSIRGIGDKTAKEILGAFAKWNQS